MNMAPYGNDDAPIHRNVTAKIVQVEWNAVKEKTHGHPETAACTKENEKDNVNLAQGEECLAGHCAVRAVGLPNLVTSILGSYRGYDTLGETGVIFTAGVGVMLLLMGRREEEEPAQRSTGGDEPHTDDQPVEDEENAVDANATAIPEVEMSAELLEDEGAAEPPSSQDEEEVQA